MSQNYEAWNIQKSDFPTNGTVTDILHFLAGYGILAPSTHNTQPWLVEAVNNELIVNRRKDRDLPQADPDSTYWYMTLGAFAANITVAANNWGYTTTFSFAKDMSLSIAITKAKVSALCDVDVITQRFSNKLPYSKKALPQTLANKIQKVSSAHKQLKVHIETDKTMNQLLDVHLVASGLVADDKLFVKELVSWLRTSNTKSYTGMPGFVMGLSNGESLVAKVVLTLQPRLFKKSKKIEKNLVRQSAGVIAITSHNKDPKTLFEAGLCYQQINLLLTSIGIQSAPLTALVHKQQQNKQACAIIHSRGTLLMFLRIGYPLKEIVAHTPRKMV